VRADKNAEHCGTVVVVVVVGVVVVGAVVVIEERVWGKKVKPFFFCSAY